MAQQFKTGNAQSDFLQRDFAKRVGRNPAYSQMAKYARGDEEDKADDYFYAFKDAYEQSPTFNRANYMDDEEMKARLGDRYWDLAYQDQKSRGVSDREYDHYYLPQFEKKYGTFDDFVGKTHGAWKRWMEENYGGYSEDHQSLGRYIRENPDKFKTKDALEQYFKEWNGDLGGYDDFFDWWRNKLFGGQQ